MARPIQLPAGDRATGEFRQLAVRGGLRPAPGVVRHRRRLESLRPPDLRRCGRADCALAASARAPAPRGTRRRARFRARALSRRAVDRTPTRSDLDAAPARPLRGRAPPRLACGRRTPLDPALGPGAPRTRRDSLRARLRRSPGAAVARRSRRKRRRRRWSGRLGALAARRSRAAVLGGRALLGVRSAIS